MNQAHERDNSLTETAAASAWEGLGVAREAHKFKHDKKNKNLGNLLRLN